ncbi:MAG: hypothetical protein ACTHLD_12555, partial [Chitinophaga sp.]
MKLTATMMAAIGMAILSAYACKKMSAKPEKEALDGERSGVSSTLGMVSYDWGNVAIGGGGYVTGMVIHPTTSNRMYARTDVGGAYRWDGTNQRWQPMLDGISTIRVDGMALDAHAPDRVYLAL